LATGVEVESMHDTRAFQSVSFLQETDVKIRAESKNPAVISAIAFIYGFLLFISPDLLKRSWSKCAVLILTLYESTYKPTFHDINGGYWFNKYKKIVLHAKFYFPVACFNRAFRQHPGSNPQ
jgi:hypothetical protein